MMEDLEETITPLAAKIVSGYLEQMRRVFSSRIGLDLVVNSFSDSELARMHVATTEQDDLFRANNIALALILPSDFEGTHHTGRPEDSPSALALKAALAQATFRILRLGLRADRDAAAEFDNAYKAIGDKLTSCNSLFNINASHSRARKFPARHFGEQNGLDFMAGAYGLDQAECTKLLDDAFARRLQRRSFAEVLTTEMRLVDTLTAWFRALASAEQGRVTRRDTIRRLLNDAGHSWETAPGVLEPPKISKATAKKLTAEKSLPSLSLRSMIEAAVLFNLEPAFDVLPTRRFELPILAMAGLVGELGWRRQMTSIDNFILAGGLIALVEERGFANKSLTGLYGDEDDADQLAKDLSFLEGLFRRAGLDPHELREGAVTYFEHEKTLNVRPQASWPPMFFLDDD
ncbi:hypothetical protein ASE94_06495 [Devosia sp. Leaf64]|nr:hypothetical protein ASE94_06495 [Devosia sp. Leaf64]